jgi:alkanesulfonate monooxygenase SsuD/methylene tetrahydromethanopterin reductase-like flavin-dependent oxidoreductase (luciferase family)
MGLMREIYLAPTDQQARAEGEAHWINFWERRGGRRTYGGQGEGGAVTLLDGGRKRELMDVDRSIAEGSFICGAPETVVRQIQKIAADAGADTFLGEFTFGMMEQRQAMNSLRLFAEQVMPDLRNFDIAHLSYPKAET